MKIVHVLTSLKIGGAERFVIDLTTIQKQSGHDVRIISFGSKKEPLVEVCHNLGIHIDFVFGNIWQRGKQLNHFYSWADVVHIHSPHALKASLLSVPVLKNKKSVYTRHGAGRFNNATWKLLHSVFQHVIDNVTFVSEDASHVFFADHNWSIVESQVIENGIPMPIISKISRIHKEGKIRIGSVGRMVELKNQLTLLKAISLLPCELLSNLEIHFFGDGECLSKLKENAQSINGTEVFFHGVVTDREQIYNNVDLLAVTSETEGLSLAIIEAMSYKVPTIASQVGGNPRLVINDETGHLYSDCFNASELALIIKNYIEQPSLILKQGENAREFVETHFSLNACNSKYMKLYNQ